MTNAKWVVDVARRAVLNNDRHIREAKAKAKAMTAPAPQVRLY
jgi:hypothetical protein